MKNHKLKILPLVIASTFLYGCNYHDNSDSGSDSVTVQAYDGPVRGMTGTTICDDGSTGTSPATDDNGETKVTLPTFVNLPETCSSEFVGGANAVDMENGKSMSGVTYKAPKGFFKAGQKATVSPFTTLIVSELAGGLYNESAAIDILGELGLDLGNNGVDIYEFLTNTDEVVSGLASTNATLFSQVSATKMILSDVIEANPDADASLIAEVTKKLSEAVIVAYPDFPLDDSSEPKAIFIDFADALASASLEDIAGTSDVMTIPGVSDAINNPEEAITPDSGGEPTGGTGAGGSGGTGA